MNCWEFMKCDKVIFEKCPAYPNHGLDCWKVTGTKCGKGQLEKATIHEKVHYCRQCEFFKEYAHKM